MALHGEQIKEKPATLKGRLARIISLLIVIAAVASIFMFRDNIWMKISKVLASAEEDPIPIEALVKTDFQLEIPAYGEIVGLESVPVPTPSTRSGGLRVAWLIPEGSFIKEGDALVRYDSSDALLNLEKQQNTLASNNENIKVTTANQTTNEKNLATDKLDAEKYYDYTITVLPSDETIFSKWDIIEAQLNAGVAKTRIDLLTRRGAVQKRNAKSDQQLLVVDKNKAEAEIAITQQTLSSLELKSPKTGLVLWRRDRMRDPQVGDESQPGQVLVEVIDLNALMARIYVLEREASALTKGQPVTIRLDSIPDKTYHGTIRTVSALAQPLQRQSPLKYFTCEVVITDAGTDMKMIKPGMAITKAKVVPEKYENCFVVPASAVTMKNMDALVYLKQGERFVPRGVKIGYGTHGQAILLDGVKEGELIALRNPFETRKAKLPDFSKAGVSGRGGPGGPGGPGMMGGGGGRGH
jgi:HlyD family secretion protein